jgi:tetratricopeptide (TPR) repeat protein
LIGLVIVAAYSEALDGAMQFDDIASIKNNLAIKDLGGFLRDAFWQRLGRGGRVITDLTFAVDYARGRLEPRPFHVTSVICHLAAALLLFFLSRKLLTRVGWPSPEWPALAITALWALHPLNSQAVSYVVQRAEVLASIGYALAVLLVLAAAERGLTATGIACYAGSMLAALVGFESKPIVVSLPAALLAALWAADLPGGSATTRTRHVWPARLALALPFGLAALGYGRRTIALAAGHADIGFDIPALQDASYPATQTRVVLGYLRQLAWPDGLSIDHDVGPSRSWMEPGVIGSGGALLLLVIGVGLLAWSASRPGRDPRLARASRLAAFGVAWWFVLLSPTSSVVPLADLMMDHRPYLASWGIVLAVVVLVAALLDRVPGLGPRAAKVGMGAAAVVALALSVALHERNRVWASPAATWTDVVEKAPRYWRGWQNLGEDALRRGDHTNAKMHLGRALALATRPQEKLDTLCNMGALLSDTGAPDQALNLLEQADHLGLESATVKFNLAIALTNLGRLEEAEAYARRAIALAPQSSPGYAALGQILVRRDDLPGGLQAFRRAVELDPDATRPLQNVAVAQEILNRPLEACATWRRYGQIQAGAEKARLERSRLGCDLLESGTR